MGTYVLQISLRENGLRIPHLVKVPNWSNREYPLSTTMELLPVTKSITDCIQTVPLAMHV